MDFGSILGTITAAAGVAAVGWGAGRLPPVKTKEPARTKWKMQTDQLHGLNIVQPDEVPEIEQASSIPPVLPMANIARNSICFVHGVTGDARSTWTARDPNSEKEIFWPTELLAKQSVVDKSFPRTRIMFYGYDTNVNSVCWLTERTLYHHANNLLIELTKVRADCHDRPLVFVAHSLGGLLVKSALIFGHNAGNSSPTDARKIYCSTVGIVSFGTPQTFAGNPPLSDIIARLCRLPDALVSRYSASKPKYDDIDSDSWKHDVEIFQRRLDHYKLIAEEIPEVFCYESSSLLRLGRDPIATQDMTVPPKRDFVHSLCKVVSIKRNHLEMARFFTCDHEFKIISESITSFYKNTLQKRNKDHSEIEKTTLDSSRSVRDSGFVVEPKLPPRPKFVSRKSRNSREDYLESLGKQLSTYRLAVLSGPFGHGKTTLALEYAYRQTELADRKRPSSIFWLSAESKLSLEASFMKIIRQLREHYDLDANRSFDKVGYSDVIHALRNVQLDENGLPKRAEDRRFAIRAVLDWLSYPENKKWLLIYDDVEEEAASYLEEFVPRDFLFGKAIRGQIIMTSRDDHKKLSGVKKDHIELDQFRQDQKEQRPTKRTDQRRDESTNIKIPVVPPYKDLDNDKQHRIDSFNTGESKPSFLGPGASDPPKAEFPKIPLRRLTEPIQVGKFNRDESKALIEDLSESATEALEGSQDKDEIFNNIAEKFFDVPLDLAHAGTFISSTEVPETARNALAEKVDLFKDIPSEHTEWFNTCVMLGRDSIPMFLIQLHFGMSLEEVRRGLKELQALGWAVIDGNSESFKIPGPRWRFRRQELEGQDRKREFAGKACNAMTKAVNSLNDEDDNYITRSSDEQLLIKHVEECLEHFRQYGDLLKNDWDILGELSERHGLFYEAAIFYRAVDWKSFDDVDTLSQASRPLPTRPSDELLLDQQFESQSSKSADIWNNPPEDPEFESSYMNSRPNDTKKARKLRCELGLIRVQLQLQQFDDLDKRCEDIIQRVEKRSEKRYFDLWAGALEQLVNVKVAQEEWLEAIKISRRLIDILEERFGRTADETARAINQLAQIHTEQGDYEGAGPLLEQSLMAYELTLGNSHPRTIAVLEMLARAYKEQGYMERARDSYRRVLEARRNQLGEDHIETAKVKESLAIVLDMMGEFWMTDYMYNEAIHAAGLLGEEGEKNAEYERMTQNYEMIQRARHQDKASPHLHS